jgi:GNAT superfamily N-acetyltransferase
MMSSLDAPNIAVRLASEADADPVAQLVLELLEELASPGNAGYELATVASTVRHVLKRGDRVWAFLAEAGGHAIGVLTLNECASIYAGGEFGEICELYVSPRFRSLGVGKRLLEAAVEFAHRRGWSRLEVGAPEIPKWERTVDFYRQAGFSEVGPRLKLPLGVASG